jgi:hypothetical protein
MEGLTMAEGANDVGLAILATLEARARKKGKKSIVKAVVRRLRDAGASEQILAEVASLNEKRRSNERPIMTKKASKAKVTSKKTNGAKAERSDPAALNAS